MYRAGDYWCLCDICGFKWYRSDCTRTWDNLLVCPKCYDGPRNPQDYAVKSRDDRQYVSDPRPDEILKPTIIETVEPTSITSTTASSGGNISYNGGASVTAHGVCWATFHAPTTSDSSTNDGTGTGEFISSLTGLSANTIYYVRAYAINSIGTAYGPEKEFTTSS